VPPDEGGGMEISMAEKIVDQVVLQNNVLRAQDFVRLRVLTGFADIPIEHAKRALDGVLVNPRKGRYES